MTNQGFDTTTSRQPRLMTMPQTLGIVGAGTIGCFLGAMLSQHKQLAVQFFGRESLALELAAYGLTVSCPGQSPQCCSPAFYTSLVSLIECDLVLLTVKATSLPGLIPQLKKFLRPEVPVLALQNGIGIAEMLQHELPNPVYRAIVPFNVVKSSAGHFSMATEGALLWPKTADQRLNYLATLLQQQGLTLRYVADMQRAEYGKLLLNLNNALNAVSGMPLRAQLREPQLRQVLATAMQEWLDVCKALALQPLAMTPLPNAWLPALLRLPTWLFQLLAGSMLKIEPHARSSMWDDIQARRRTEIMYLNGAVIRLGIQTGVPTPVNAAIVELVKHLEQGEVMQFSPAELCRRLTNRTC